MTFPEDLRYTKDHEWIKLDGNKATVGITEYAQGELGDVIYLDVNTGKSVDAHGAFGTVEAVKTVSDLYAPVAGTVDELNPSLADSPELVNKDPYGDGWLVKMTVKDPAEINSLLTAAQYRELIGQ
jgi:glycine cleavage system H protein